MVRGAQVGEGGVGGAVGRWEEGGGRREGRRKAEVEFTNFLGSRVYLGFLKS